MDAMCKEGVRKKVFTPKGLLYNGEIKKWIPHKNNAPAFTKFPPYFNTWSPEHRQNLSILITFGSSKLSSFITVAVGRIWFKANYCLVIILYTLHSCMCTTQYYCEIKMKC